MFYMDTLASLAVRHPCIARRICPRPPVPGEMVDGGWERVGAGGQGVVWRHPQLPSTALKVCLRASAPGQTFRPEWYAVPGAVLPYATRKYTRHVVFAIPWVEGVSLWEWGGRDYQGGLHACAAARHLCETLWRGAQHAAHYDSMRVVLPNDISLANVVVDTDPIHATAIDLDGCIPMGQCITPYAGTMSAPCGLLWAGRRYNPREVGVTPETVAVGALGISMVLLCVDATSRALRPDWNPRDDHSTLETWMTPYGFRRFRDARVDGTNFQLVDRTLGLISALAERSGELSDTPGQEADGETLRSVVELILGGQHAWAKPDHGTFLQRLHMAASVDIPRVLDIILSALPSEEGQEPVTEQFCGRCCIL